MSARATLLASLGFLTGCIDGDQSRKLAAAFQGRGPRPDEAPVMLNTELPFRYPAALYARKIQGNVTLRLFIDRDGKVFGDSTRVEESSGYGSLDSSAVLGSRLLRFIPAKLRGEPIAVPILFPVYFRHPEAAGLPGDTVLRKRDERGSSRDGKDGAKAPTSSPSR